MRVMDTNDTLSEEPRELTDAQKRSRANLKPGSKRGRKPVSKLLSDLRYVYKETDASKDTRGQAALRRLWEADPDRFMDRLQKAEVAHRAGGKQAGSKVEPSKVEEEVDEGSDRALAVVLEAIKNREWELED